MNGQAELPWFRRPPHANASDYLTFVTELLAHADPVKTAHQKALEERIEVPFRLVDVPDARRPADHDGESGGIPAGGLCATGDMAGNDAEERFLSTDYTD